MFDNEEKEVWVRCYIAFIGRGWTDEEKAKGAMTAVKKFREAFPPNEVLYRENARKNGHQIG